jgi:hypothetical protein
MTFKEKIELPLAQIIQINRYLKLSIIVICIFSVIIGTVLDIVFNFAYLKIVGGIAFILMQIFALTLPDGITDGKIVFMDNEVWIIRNNNESILKIPKGNIKKVKISDHKKIIIGLKFIHRNYGAGNKIYSDMGDYNFILNDKVVP